MATLPQFDAQSQAKARASRQESETSTKNVDELVAVSLPGLLPDIRAKIVRRASEMPRHHRLRYMRAMRGKSAKIAIKAHCWECMGWESNPAECTAPACAMFHHRPGA